MEILLYKYTPVASYEIGQYFNGKGAEETAAYILTHTILGVTVRAASRAQAENEC